MRDSAILLPLHTCIHRSVRIRAALMSEVVCVLFRQTVKRIVSEYRIPHDMAQASILNRALSVYALPPELLDSLAVRSIQAQAVDKEKAVAEADQQPEPTQLAAATGLGCQACPGAVFDTPDDQRAHFKSDWHRYNAKAKLQGKAVTSDEWDKMADGGWLSRYN